MEYVTKRATDLSQISEIYKARMKEDFPPDELKPLSAIKNAWERDSYDAYFLVRGEEIIGYAFFVRNGKHYLLDYLAIAKEHRDKGLGTVFLRQLRECLRDADCVIGEVDDPDKTDDTDEKALRERRLRFYLRNGYLKTEVTSRVFGVDYRILELPVGAEHTADEIRETYSELYRGMLPKVIYKTQFKVDIGKRAE